MAKAQPAEAPAASQMPQASAQAAAPQYYQPVAYAPAPPKQAKHPALELSVAVISILASAWFFVDALTSSILMLGDNTPSFDSVTTFFTGYVTGFTGVVITALTSLVFAGLAFWLFRRLNAAVESDKHKGAIHVGAGVAGIKTVLLAATTVSVGLAPLLTLRDGSNVGPVYLYQFLPLIVGTAVFAFVTWYLLKLADKQQVGKMLATVMLIATGAVFVLGLVTVIVKSHTGSYSSSSSSNYTRSTGSSNDSKSSTDNSTKNNSSDDDSDTGSSSRNNSGSSRDSSGSGTKSASSECYDDYLSTKDYNEYLDCISEAYDY
jgi:hypothetical protein